MSLNIKFEKPVFFSALANAGRDESDPRYHPYSADFPAALTYFIRFPGNGGFRHDLLLFQSAP